MRAIDGYATSGKVRVAFRDYGGSGPDLLLMHGGGRNLTDMEPLVPLMSNRARIVAMDLRGHGLSDEPDAWQWDDTVSDVEAVIEEVGLINPFVAGHSMGGMVAAFYGVRHSACPGVANIDGPGRGAPSFPQELLDDLRRQAEQVELPADCGDEDWVTDQIAPMRAEAESLGIDWTRAEPALRRSYVRSSHEDGLFCRRPSNRFVKTFPDVGPDLFDVYRAVRCPLLIVSCTKTGGSGLPEEVASRYRECLMSDLDELASERANVRVATVETGHMVNLENPSWLAATLTEFMG